MRVYTAARRVILDTRQCEHWSSPIEAVLRRPHGADGSREARSAIKSENEGPAPDCAEPVIGRRFAPTRWLHPGYSHCAAYWVVLSACNTAGGEASNSEAFSGLARAFFYAGTRALLVSHWPVSSEAAVAITTGATSAMTSHPPGSCHRSILPMVPWKVSLNRASVEPRAKKIRPRISPRPDPIGTGYIRPCLQFFHCVMIIAAVNERPLQLSVAGWSMQHHQASARSNH